MSLASASRNRVCDAVKLTVGFNFCIQKHFGMRPIVGYLALLKPHRWRTRSVSNQKERDTLDVLLYNGECVCRLNMHSMRNGISSAKVHHRMTCSILRLAVQGSKSSIRRSMGHNAIVFLSRESQHFLMTF